MPVDQSAECRYWCLRESGDYVLDWRFNLKCPKKGIDVHLHTPDSNYTLVVAYETNVTTTCDDREFSIHCPHLSLPSILYLIPLFSLVLDSPSFPDEALMVLEIC